MTVSTTDSVEEYVSGGPAFPIPYRFLQNSDIQAVLVHQDGTSETLVLGTQYTLTGAGSQSGGTLTSTYAASVLATPGATLSISRVMMATQPTDLRNQGRYFAETHENVFDRLTMLIQQGFSGLSRALKRPAGKNYYDAKGRQIKNVADPTQDQDAATKKWTSVFIGNLISAITGPINNALNIFYKAPDGTSHVVQDLSGPDGTKLIGRGTPPGTLEDHLLTLASQDDLTDLQAMVVTHQSTTDGSGRQVPDPGHYMRYDLAFTKRPKPPGFSWLPFEILGMQANGKVAVSKTARQIMDAIATLSNLDTEGYVDNVGGNNANTGTLVQPWQTLTYAVTQAAYTTKLTTGVHVPPLAYDRTGITGNRVRKIIGSGDPLSMKDVDDPNVTAFRIVGDDLTTKTWTLNASAPILAQCTITSGLTVQAVMMTRYKDEFGRSKPLPLRASAADVASLGGWYFAAGVLYVRCGLNAQFDTTVKPYLKAVYTQSDSTGYVRHNGAEVYYENCAFVGFFPLADNAGGFPSKLVFKNCSFWYSRVSAVLAQGGQVYLDNCEIYRCRGDGVNSHASNGIECTHVTINTIARFCGDIDTLNTALQSNENGMSMHENGNAAILGGSIYKSGGPGLIDTGSGPGSTGVSLWYGVHSEESVGADPVNFDTYGVRKVWMEQCSERGDASVAPRVQNAGTVLRYGANSVRGYTQVGSGEAVAFDPLNPV